MRKLKFMKGYSYPRRNLRRDEEILSLGQEIGLLKNRLDTIETQTFESGSKVQSIPKKNQIPNSIDVVRNIGNMGISDSDSVYEKEKPLEMEGEMEMEE